MTYNYKGHTVKIKKNHKGYIVSYHHFEQWHYENGESFDMVCEATELKIDAYIKLKQLK